VRCSRYRHVQPPVPLEDAQQVKTLLVQHHSDIQKTSQQPGTGDQEGDEMKATKTPKRAPQIDDDKEIAKFLREIEKFKKRVLAVYADNRLRRERREREQSRST
jgi:hypothetical protein